MLKYKPLSTDFFLLPRTQLGGTCPCTRSVLHYLSFTKPTLGIFGAFQDHYRIFTLFGNRAGRHQIQKFNMSSLIDVSENTDPHDVPYRLRLRVVDGNDNHRLVDISEHPEVTEETRKRWILKVTDYIWGPRSDHSFTAIRPWDFIVSVDGAVESLPVSDVNRKGNGMYPPRYRIPPTSIQSLEEKEKVRRQERFAFASLLYEIGCNKKPFEELNDEELQQRYSDADFPEDVRSLPLPLFINILSNWSVEFANISKPKT